MLPRDTPDVAPPPARENGYVTFGCFNDVLKLNSVVLGCWAQILARTPGSRLLLKARMLVSSDVRARTLAELGQRGVDSNRVTLLGPTAARTEHLQTYARVDLGLDTFPYAGATTTCEALWMGVPVITLAGDRHAGRLGVSILSAAGLEALIAPTREAYVELAVRHALDACGRTCGARSARGSVLHPCLTQLASQPASSRRRAHAIAASA